MNQDRSYSLNHLVRPIFWLIIVGLTLYFISYHFIHYYKTGIPESFGTTLFHKRIWYYVHIGTGTIAILLGPLQFWKTIRLRYMRFHRVAGICYIISSILAVICLVWILPESGCVACRPSQTVVSSLWLLTTIAAWWTIKRKNIKAHQQFMARSYLFGFYFVAVRIIDYLGQNFFGFSNEDGVWMANGDWFVWVVPFILLEIYQSWWPEAKRNYVVKGKAS